MRYIKGLDTLRAFAVFFVIITHWGPHTIHSSKALTFFLTRVLPDGLFGVDLFFVLSGFLITSILLKAKSEASYENRFGIIKAFYIRRSLRIFPIYFLLIFILYLLNNQDVQEHLPYFLTYTSNFFVFKTQVWAGFSHTWSLAVEEQFYLVWPWVIIFSPPKYLVGICLSCFALGFLSCVILEHVYGSFFYVLPLPCITAFAVGALYACSQSNPEMNKKTCRIFLVLLPVAIVLFLLYQFDHKYSIMRAGNAVIAINAIIYVVKEKYNVFTAFILNNRLFTSIGKVSYGIYLYHYVVPGIYYNLVDHINKSTNFSPHTYKLLKNPPSSYLINLAIVLLVSYVSYYFFELKIIKLKTKFAYVQR
jgi:peptidoglycan/LPS O-acetylase OafA/YrhL